MLDGNADININAPKIDVPKVDINVPGIDIHGPKVETPQINVPMPKADIHGNLPSIGAMLDPNANIDINAPKIEGRMDIPKLRANVQGPKIDAGIDIKKPKIDIPGIGADIHGPKMDIKPKINIPELNIHGPKIGGEIGLPDSNIEAEIGLKKPILDIPGIDIDINKPRIDDNANVILPPLGEILSSDLDINSPQVNMPAIDLSNPTLEDIPSVEIDVQEPMTKTFIKSVDTFIPKLEI